MNLIFCIIVLILTNFTIATAPPINVVFIIQSQDTTYQNELSRNLKEDIIKQSFELQPKYRIKVHVLHEIFNYPGGWTIHNLIPQLMLYQRKSHLDNINTNTNTNTKNMNTNTNTNQQIEMKVEMKIVTEKEERKSEREDIITNNTRWIVFCEDTTKVKVKLLMERLNNENHTQPLYLGHPLYDREPTIIHHFAFFENPKWFPYPMLQAGVVFSWPLFKSIADIYHNHNRNNNNNNKQFKQSTTLLQHSEFSIDAAHELARFIYDNIEIPITTKTTSTISLNNNNNHNDNNNINAQREKSSTFTTTDQPARSATLSSTQRDTFNAVDATDSVLTHSDYRHSTITTTTPPNEIIDKHKTEDITGTPGSMDASIHVAAIRNTVVTKRQKIILRKASYICAKATREAQSIGNKKNNHITSSGNNNRDTTCAMYAEQTTATAASASSPSSPSSSSSVTCVPVKRENIYFAVKTCAKYHSERLPIIQATWASYAKHVKYFSDLQDDTIPTINIGMPNVEMGHCDKTLRILKLALKDIETYNSKYSNNNNNNNNRDKYLHQQQQQHLPYDVNQAKHENHQIKWLFLTDDDTLLSVSGVCQVLGCYDSMDEIYLGERYGYRLYAQDGFNYITGGGGIAFSLPVVKLILQHCSCPSPSAPDDMILGSCLHSLQRKAIHSPRFHQARPNDYAMALLKQDPPISFHKFWQLDPFEVYRSWFEAPDRQLMVEEQQLQGNMLADGYRSKSRKLLAKPEPLNLNEIPVGLVASLHHTKERHVDL